MAKKIFTAVFAAVMLICTAGCSEYEMTDEDIALQKSIEGVWAAEYSTEYNEYDDNGNLVILTAVEFTPDYKYLLHYCMVQEGYVMTYDPIEYSFEDKYFRVDVDGTPNYAKVSVSDDGQTLLWITDEQTDRYSRLTDEQAEELGIPEYDPAAWAETEAESLDGSDTEGNSETVPESESGVTESGSGVVSENEQEGSAEEAALANLTLDPGVKYFSSLPHDDYRNYVIAEPENSGITVYGMYGTDNVIIEQDGVTDVFRQTWYCGRGEAPEAYWGDYDSDGENELAVIYDMCGEGDVKPDVLALYKKGADGHFAEYKFENAKEVAQAEFDRAEAVLGDIIHFEIAEFEPAGEFLEFVAMPEFSKVECTYISARVTFADGVFGLTNFKYGRQQEVQALENLDLDPSQKYGMDVQFEEFENYVIAEIPEENIYIYAMEGTDNIIIQHGGRADIFRNQMWLTPRQIMPLAAYEDFDGDGEKELAVSYYVGSGTGVSVEQLVIYEKSADGSFAENKFVSPENILNEKLTAVELDEENTSAVFTFDGETFTADGGEDFQYIEEILSNREEAKLRFGDIISYSFEGDKIVMNAGLGLMTMYYLADVSAEVNYEDGSFTLTNFEIGEY